MLSSHRDKNKVKLWDRNLGDKRKNVSGWTGEMERVYEGVIPT